MDVEKDGLDKDFMGGMKRKEEISETFWRLNQEDLLIISIGIQGQELNKWRCASEHMKRRDFQICAVKNFKKMLRKKY